MTWSLCTCQDVVEDVEDVEDEMEDEPIKIYSRSVATFNNLVCCSYLLTHIRHFFLTMYHVQISICHSYM
jgi:hypothetical protein